VHAIRDGGSNVVERDAAELAVASEALVHEHGHRLHVNTLKPKQEDGCKYGQHGSALRYENSQCVRSTARQPFGSEEGNDRYLRRHQQLEEMSFGALVGLTDVTEPRDMYNDQHEDDR